MFRPFLAVALLALAAGCRLRFDDLAPRSDGGPGDAADSADAPPSLMTFTFGERSTSMVQNVTTDAVINMTAPDVNFGLADPLSVYVSERTAIRFELSALPGGAQVKSALLQIEIAANGDELAGMLEAWVLDESWSEMGTTWTVRDIGMSWTQPGGTAATVAGMLSLGPVTGSIEVDITPTVQAWIDSPGTNHGLLLRTDGGHWHPYSREATDTRRPQLVVEAAF